MKKKGLILESSRRIDPPQNDDARLILESSGCALVPRMTKRRGRRIDPPELVQNPSPEDRRKFDLLTLLE
jgi:hypothetical protein